MRVSRISVFSQPTNYSAPQKNINRQTKCEKPQDETNFKGKFGSWVGGVFGAAAVVATAVLVAPAAICLTGGGAILGAIGGHVAEDCVNGDNKDD